MAKRAELSPYLPAQPLTPEQRELFDQNKRLAYSRAGKAMRKYGVEYRDDLRAAALIGLMCAAARYKTPSEASFGTYAIRTIDWTIRLLMLRDFGVRDQKRKALERTLPPFDLSDTCACEPTPDTVIGTYGTTVVDHRTPEAALIEAERLQIVERAVNAALAANPARSVAMLMRHLEGETKAAIAESYGISRERVRQLVDKAKLRVEQLTRDVA